MVVISVMLEGTVLVFGGDERNDAPGGCPEQKLEMTGWRRLAWRRHCGAAIGDAARKQMGPVPASLLVVGCLTSLPLAAFVKDAATTLLILIVCLFGRSTSFDHVCGISY